MLPLSKETLRDLLARTEAPFISLYQPTHRHRPDNQQDPIRFRNLVRSIERSLARRYPASAVPELLAPFQALAEDTSFWDHTLDGLAVLVAAGTEAVFQLQRPVKELAVVADSFHVKPLLRYLQSADRYQVLCLTRQRARLFEGNRYALDELELGDFPATITAALGDQLTEPHMTVASYGSGVRGPAMHHGHGSRSDEVEKDAERFFRIVDREALARISRPSGLPLVLVALGEHQAVFRALSQNPSLVAAGVESNPEGMDLERLRAAVWKAVEPQYVARLTRLTEEFHSAEAHQRGTAELSHAVRAAVEGRIASLMIESDREAPGRQDPASGEVEAVDQDGPGVDDELDDLAEAVLRTGGEVVVVPKERMPSPTGIAATFRF